MAPRNSISNVIALTLIGYGFGIAVTHVIKAFCSPTDAEEINEVDVWLIEQNLTEFQPYLHEKGISSLASCGQLDRLPELPAHDEERLQRAARLLQQRLILRQWLTDHHLDQHYAKLLQADVTSLEDVYWLEDSMARSIVGKDFPYWAAAREALPTSKENLKILKGDLWSMVVKSSQHEDAWTWGGMLVVSVSVAGLVTLAAMTQPTLAPIAKHSLLQYVTGKYLSPSNCKVTFDWDDPCAVGQTVSFTVKFYQRNGNAYPICDSDNFVVDIVVGVKQVAAAVELGGTDPNSANVAVVKCTVRDSGRYSITVMIDGAHVSGSPFHMNFLPGPPNPQKTTAMKNSSIIVCTVGITQKLSIEPRDEFNNICTFGENSDPTQGYSLTVNEIDCEEPISCRKKFEFDEITQRIVLSVMFTREGCFHASVCLNSIEICCGDFDVIVLSSAEADLVVKNVDSRNHEVCYEASLLNIAGRPSMKPKQVYCYVSPKQLTIKEFILKFIPLRLVTFRLCPSTKKYKYNQEEWPKFSLEDGCQPRVELASRDRNMIAATFTHFLLKNIGGSETFADKQDFFYRQVRVYHTRHDHSKKCLTIYRDRLLESSMKATRYFSVSDWCKQFDIKFVREIGLDWGGIRREWFNVVCAALFDAKNGLFTPFSDSQQALVHPNPKRPPHLKLKHYEFAGKIVGKCLYESALGGRYRQLVKARFTRSFLAQIMGLRVHYRYFQQDDPDLYLRKIKYILDNDIESMDLYFVEEEYCPNGRLTRTIDLIPNGSTIRVTNQTKMNYLNSLAQYKLATSVKDEVDHFLKGLNDLIPDSLLSIFDENELELLLCGTDEYDVQDFRHNCDTSGNTAEFQRVIDWFWTAVSNFSREEMARLLQFITGCSQLPPGGFGQVEPKIRIYASHTVGNLPSARTCFNQLYLPIYDSYEQFERALLLAITEGSEGFGLI